MLRARLATAAVAIPLLLLLITCAPLWLFAVVIGLIAALGVVEYFLMAFPARPGAQALGIGTGWVLTATTAGGQGEWVVLGIVVAVGAGLTWTLFTRTDFERGLADLGLTLLGGVYVGVLVPHFVLLRGPVGGTGAYWVIFLLAVAMAGDSSGYFAGRAFGRHKLMPRVSPSKTVEGSLAILVGSAAGAAIAKAGLIPILAISSPDVSWGEAIGLALLLGVLGQLGDLSESMMKRTFAAKESGWVLPGHGGVLDRVDSLVFPVALLYYYTLLYR